MLFQRKKLFGNHISPNCDYCRFSAKNNSGNLVCVGGAFHTEEPCKKYVYDPLKREPLPAPTLPKFTADDFKL